MLLGNWNLDASPVYLMFDLLGRVASPYELNPLNLNPLRELLDELVDFERVRACEHLKIYVSATDVETGRVKVFERPELTADMVMASACLPHIFQRSEEHTSELQSLMRISYAVFCLKKKKIKKINSLPLSLTN